MTLARLNEVTPESCDLTHLRGPVDAALLVERRLTAERRETLARDPLGAEVIAALDAALSKVVPFETRLIHDDYWPANVLWERGRVSAVVDWTMATLGDASTDVAQCRVDLALIGTPDDPDDFLDDYRRAGGPTPVNLRFYELLIGAVAMTDYETGYVPGYRDLGLEVTADEVGSRLRTYLTQILDRS